MKKVLIIFYKNPKLGKVKTRLAATLGDEAALAIYYLLASHTRTVTDELKMEKSLWYSDFVDREDHWENQIYSKQLQKGAHLGERMQYAFKAAFDSGAKEVCIIGTDCFELNATHIQTAFSKLEDNDVVIGPAQDGGYYLLGMKRLVPELFNNKEWSTEHVLSDSIKDLKKLGMGYAKLPLLNDVDIATDLPDSILKKFKK